MDEFELEIAQPDPFEVIAHLIAGEDAPPWLAEHLKLWIPSIRVARVVEKRQPGRSEMKNRLVKIGKAAALLTRALDEPSTREFLEAGPSGPIENIGAFGRSLKDLADRADHASASPALADKTGKTRAGRGRATPPGALSAQAYCALLVAEAWRYFHCKYPPPRSGEAAQAAEAYWRATGVERKGWGNDPLNAWRHHFNAAKALKTADKLRTEIRRHLEEHAREVERLSQPDP
jgi:hypothetical protein